MAMIVGVRFRESGKTYYFAPAKDAVHAPGDLVVVETSRGVECGEVTIGNREVEDKTIVSPLKPVLRKALPEDIRRHKANCEKEKEALRVCQQKAAAHELDMKVVDVECSFDGSKILFYFTAEGRVDLRALNCARSACATRPKCLAVSASAGSRFAARAFCRIFSRFPSKWQSRRVCP